MIVERTEDEVILRLPSNIDIVTLQRIRNYLDYMSRIQKSAASQSQAESMAEDSKARWWNENKSRFV